VTVAVGPLSATEIQGALDRAARSRKCSAAGPDRGRCVGARKLRRASCATAERWRRSARARC
jgi:hypothetical protein